jgi:hypothetical protein
MECALVCPQGCAKLPAIGGPTPHGGVFLGRNQKRPSPRAVTDLSWGAKGVGRNTTPQVCDHDNKDSVLPKETSKRMSSDPGRFWLTASQDLAGLRPHQPRGAPITACLEHRQATRTDVSAQLSCGLLIVSRSFKRAVTAMRYRTSLVEAPAAARWCRKRECFATFGSSSC